MVKLDARPPFHEQETPMPDNANLKVLFIAGFGPIGRDTGESRKLYRDVLGISLCGKPVDRMDRKLATIRLRGR
jgi:hypothetical protein